MASISCASLLLENAVTMLADLVRKSGLALRQAPRRWLAWLGGRANNHRYDIACVDDAAWVGANHLTIVAQTAATVTPGQ